MFSNILVKMIGMVFKIPLQRLIGLDAMSYFNAAYNIYVLFYMVSTAGLPVAISRLVATADTKKSTKEVQRIFNVSFLLFLGVGFAGTAIMIIFSHGFAEASGMSELYYAIIAIAPTLFFICLTSAYRGYFQGLRNMTPTAVSQTLEALGKLLLGLLFGWIAIENGYSNAQVAAFVIFGVTVGVAVSTGYLAIEKVFRKYQSDGISKEPVSSSKSILKSLISIAIPITISSSIMSLMNIVDTMLIVNRLSATGMEEEVARKLYGAYTTMSVPLFNMPPTLIYPFAISIIPILTETFLTKNSALEKSIKDSTLRITTAISIPCAFGLAAMAKEVISLIGYKNEYIYTDIIGNEVYAFDVAGPLLSVLAPGILFVGMISVTNSMLQASGHEWKTIISSALGVVAKMILTYILLDNNVVGIYGAAISTLCAYLTIMIANFYFVVKTTGYIPKITKIFLRPIIPGTLCGTTALLVYMLLDGFMRPSFATILSIGTAAMVYLVFMFLFKAVNREDIALLPKGEKLCSLLDKIHFFR